MKYRVKFTTAYKKGYKRAKKRGLIWIFWMRSLMFYGMAKNSMRNIMTMHYTEILMAFGNVISSRIGCWFILSRRIF